MADPLAPTPGPRYNLRPCKTAAQKEAEKRSKEEEAVRQFREMEQRRKEAREERKRIKLEKAGVAPAPAPKKAATPEEEEEEEMSVPKKEYLSFYTTGDNGKGVSKDLFILDVRY